MGIILQLYFTGRPRANSTKSRVGILNIRTMKASLVVTLTFYDKAFVLSKNACPVFKCTRDSWFQLIKFSTDVSGLTYFCNYILA